MWSFAGGLRGFVIEDFGRRFMRHLLPKAPRTLILRLFAPKGKLIEGFWVFFEPKGLRGCMSPRGATVCKTPHMQTVDVPELFINHVLS